MIEHHNENAPYSIGEQQDALSSAFAGAGTEVASIPSDRLYRLAALTTGIFLLVSLF